jgi:hypothetical protein
LDLQRHCAEVLQALPEVHVRVMQEFAQEKPPTSTGYRDRKIRVVCRGLAGKLFGIG